MVVALEALYKSKVGDAVVAKRAVFALALKMDRGAFGWASK